MKLDPEKQHDEIQQMARWPKRVSNEGHVYAALGVDPTSLAFEELTCLLEDDDEESFAFRIAHNIETS